MRSPVADELNLAVDKFKPVLEEQGWVVRVLPPKAYAVKLQITMNDRFVGYAIIYYSPKKKLYNFGTRELKDNTVAEIANEVWNKLEISGNITDGAEKHLSSKLGKPGTIVYVDGSHRNGIATYGLVAIDNGEMVHEDAGLVLREDWLAHHNIAGEMEGVLQALNWSAKMGLKEVTIVHDYEGLAKWATGEYQAKTTATRQYVEEVGASSVRITWQWVRGHGNDPWNERADQLAKSALGNDPSGKIKETDPETDLNETFEELCRLGSEHGIEVRKTLHRNWLRQFVVRRSDDDSEQPEECKGKLYGSTKHAPKLRMEGNIGQELRRQLARIWEMRRLRIEPRLLPGSRLIRTNHAYQLLSPYREARVNLMPLKTALQEDLLEATHDVLLSSEDHNLFTELLEKVKSSDDSWDALEQYRLDAMTLLENYNG